MKRKLRAKRRVRRTILVVCEGAETEKLYFIHLRGDLQLTAVDVKSSGRKTAPSQIVRKAIEAKNKRAESDLKSPYDETWCVLDADASTMEQLKTSISEARKCKVNVALSNPCFEFWYLLHFNYCASHFRDCAAVVHELKKYQPQYVKSDGSICDAVAPNRGCAVSNAAQVLKHHNAKAIAGQIAKCNPSTNVHKLVELLLQETG